jgi:hypothetical protein
MACKLFSARCVNYVRLAGNCVTFNYTIYLNFRHIKIQPGKNKRKEYSINGNVRKKFRYNEQYDVYKLNMHFSLPELY